MKKIYFLLLLASGFLNAQIVAIPNPAFKAKLIALGVDTNADGNIQVTEALARTSLDLSESGLTSVEGIEAFTNLTSLNLFNNHYITELDIANLTNLTFLNCARNNLTGLNVSTLTNLTHLTCYSNNLYSIDDVTPLVNLTLLDCAENHIPVLNVGGLTNLTHLNCTSNNINVLNVTNLTNLTELYCGSNSLSTLDVGLLTNLTKFYCNFNQLTSINLLPLTQLTMLICDRNLFTNLDLSTLTNLTWLHCGNSQLTSLNLNANTNLENLSLFFLPFPTVDLSQLTLLRGLGVFAGNLESVDISTAPLLTHFRLTSTTHIRYLNLKNGGTIDPMYLTSSSNVTHICCNQGDLATVNLQMSATNTASTFTANSNCLFFPVGDYNTVTGKVRFDHNTDGCNVNDVLQPNVKMKITSGTNIGYTYTNADGDYFFFPQAGSFTISPVAENIPYFNFTPSSASVNFSNNNANVATRDFCSGINGSHIDVEVVLVPINPARPGFDATYKIVYRNKGNQTVSGDITLTFEDDVLDYVLSSIPLNSQSLNMLSWNYSDLLPFESREFTLVMNANSPVETPAVNIGDELDFSAVISPIAVDEFAYDNTFGLKQTVVGSFDPNDKACLEGNIVSPERIGQYLHYNINFENTGTFAAERIVVKDVIDTTKFDIASLQVMNTSATCTTRVAGNTIEFVFDDINLGAGQHGNVMFKIKTKSILVEGATVSNTAGIYFDYNAPVITNTASTTFQTLGMGENPIDNAVVIYPNPASDYITITAADPIKSVQLFDVQGRLLMIKFEQESNINFDISHYSTGIYFVKISTEHGSKTEQLVKE